MYIPALSTPANWFKFEELMASYMLELLALKAELQSSLARLGVEPVSSSDEDANLLAGASLATETAVSALRRSSRSSRRRPISRWNRRQLTHELAAASERRRELEQQLEREMQQDREASGQQEQRERRSRRTSAYQAAIAELQQQRAEIRRQIEAETEADEEAIAEMQADEVDARADVEVEQNPVPVSSQHSRTLNTSESLNETHYSIGGLVTLEPVSSRQQTAVLGSSRTGLSIRPVATVPVAQVSAALPSVLEDYPRFRQTPDALNDVFLLQLKFAETMLKLEKSVQMRDQLLHHGGPTSLKRRNASQTREEESQTRRRNGRHLPHRRRSVSGSSSDSSAVLRESRHSESFSSSAYSFSSLDSTPRRGQTIRVRYPNLGVSRATTAETLAPSSTGGGNSPDSETVGGAAPVSSTSTTTLSPGDSPDTQGDAAPDRRSSEAVPGQFTEEQREEIHRTPTTGSSVTTPTTGSDQKSTTSSSKQVRFGNDPYSTPVLARKFNFDNPSMDEDDDEEKEEESLLSFLGGSSVTSAELNDASFLRAFERFRRELNATKHNSVMQSPVLARKLFPAASPLEQVEAMQSTSGAAQTVEPSSIGDQGQALDFPALDGLDLPALKERRRQLCLDIQAESAQLVLNFGAMQNVGVGSLDAAATKDRLLDLRDELKHVDKRIDELQ